MKPFPWAVYWIVLAVILAIMLAPVGSVVAAGVIADANGCRVDEGSVHPCMIGGSDWGETLYTLGVLGWLMLISLPLGFLAAIVWLVVLLIHRAVARRRIAP